MNEDQEILEQRCTDQGLTYQSHTFVGVIIKTAKRCRKYLVETTEGTTLPVYVEC